MKIRMTCFLVPLFLLAGCGLIEKAAEVTISTELTSNMLITATGGKSAEISAEVNAIEFSKSEVLSLKNNPDIKPYLSNIKKTEIISVTVDIFGLGEGQVVKNLALDVKDVGTIARIEGDVTFMFIAYAPVIDFDKLALASTKLKKEKEITLIVHGTANVPLSFNIQMRFPVDVVAGALD
jgi:hypothetical protein